MIDDSIVRGTTSDRIVQMLREAGAKEVHMRVSSPPFLSSVLFRYGCTGAGTADRHNRTIEEIRQIIGADSLGVSADWSGCRRWSTGCRSVRGCFTGEYPLEPPTEDIRGEYE